MTDRELLTRYSAGGSSEAFAEIVNRYSGMVHAACLRILGDSHAAEDATQATFLIFMRKARKLPRKTVLSGWLFLTAQHAALNARKQRARRERHERKAAAMLREGKKPSRPAWDDVRPELDTAISSLPARQRDAVVLYYLGNKSEEEVAREMGCARGTVAAHISSAMTRLRGRLAGRGISISAAALAGFLAEQAAGAAAAAPAGLAESIIAACTGTAAVSASAGAIAEGTVKALAWAKVKTLSLVLGTAVVVAGGGTAAVGRLSAEYDLVDDPAIVALLTSLGEGRSTLLPPLRVIGPRQAIKDVRGREVYRYGAGVRHRCRRMVYAPSRRSALYCGSWHKSFSVNDVWEYHLGANTWRVLSESDGGNHLVPNYARAGARYGRDPEKNTARFRDWYRRNVTFRDGTLMTRGNGGPLSPIMTWDQLAYDPDRKRIYWMTGGAGHNDFELYAEALGLDPEELEKRIAPGTNLWWFDVERRRWSRQTGPEPRPRSRGMCGTLRYVPDTGKLIWYIAAMNTVPYEFKMWAYDAGANSWRDLAPNGGANLQKLSVAGLIPGGGIQSAYSSRHRALVAVGGELTWCYDLDANEWNPVCRDPLSDARDAETIFVYNGKADVFLLADHRENKVRAFDLDAGQWRTLEINGPAMPEGVSAGYYDPRFDVLVIYGTEGRVWVYRCGRSSL
jgi:RNA polymerase sigma factor (sigma-70 family)